MSEVVPLEIRKTYDSKSKTFIPTLSPQRTIPLTFIKFEPPPLSDLAEHTDSFIELVMIICSDLNELLDFQFDQFWCQMLFNKSLRHCLRSILSWAPRGLQSNSIPESCRTDYCTLLTLILSVFLRASEAQESETNFISKNKFGELLYEHYVFDIPTLMDICAIYFHLSTVTVVKIMSNVFHYQELYLNDLKCTTDLLSELFQRVEHEINAPEKLKGFDRLLDVTFYLSDISWSLFTFLNVLSQLNSSTPTDICFTGGVHEKLASLYEYSLVPLRNAIEGNLQVTQSQRETLLSHLSNATVWLVTTVRSAFCERHLLSPIRQMADKSDPASTQEAVNLSQRYLDFMLQMLNYRNFSLAFQLMYRFDQDLAFLRRSIGTKKLDDAAVQYLTSAVEALFTEAGVSRLPVIPNPQQFALPTRACSDSPKPGPSIDGPVREVKEVLPDMDINLIQRCLDAFDQDSARVINAALEGSIPDHVLNGESKPSSPEGPAFDFNEELSVTRAMDSIRIPRLRPNQVWQGKRDESEGNQLPELSKRLKRVTIRSAVSIWEDVEDDERGGAVCHTVPEEQASDAPRLTTVDAYEDEYDDTYDVHEGAVDDASSSAESDVAEESPDQAAKSSNMQSHWSNTGAHAQNRPQPYRPPVLRIENPEVIRERQHMQRAYRRGRFAPGNSRQPNVELPPPQPLPPAGDFPPGPAAPGPTGYSWGLSQQSDRGQRSKPEGDRQVAATTAEESTHSTGTADRAYKNTHKARFANHNRRRLADRKRQF